MFSATLYHAEPEVQSPKVKIFFAKDKRGAAMVGYHSRPQSVIYCPCQLPFCVAVAAAACPRFATAAAAPGRFSVTGADCS